MREGGAWDSPDMDQDEGGSESEDKEEVTNNGHGYEDNQSNFSEGRYDSQLAMDTDEDNRTIGPANNADVLDPQDLDYGDSIDDSGDDDLEANQEYDTHRPVLSVMNAETGTHFKELLKWMYHGDGQRWLRCFTPQNYTGILHNIDRFNLCALPEVMHVCLAFEASTPPELNLQGLALRMWERLFSHTTEANVIYVPDPDQQQHQQYHQEEEEELEEEEEEKSGQARVQ
ncbi:hypothetical protein BGZ98_002934 [Dissophora globulifera]|nr:hypothetical protein BGZ98_002934 [Dissophora globulifera]